MNLMNSKLYKRIINSVIVLVVFAIIFILIFNPYIDNKEKYSSLEDFSDKKIAMVTGSTYLDIAKENGLNIDNATILEYNNELDAISALSSGKVDAFIDCELYSKEYFEAFHNISKFPETVGVIDYSLGFQKGSPLKVQFNETMRKLIASGEIQKLHDKWYVDDLSTVEPIKQDWVGENGTLNYWLNIGVAPVAYLSEGGEIIGYTIDYVYTIAKELGYNVEITECNFGGLIPALVSGQADLAGRSIAVTEERKQSIDFCDPLFSSDLILICRTENIDESLLSEADKAKIESNIIQSVKDSFYKTFIKENRYELFVKGIITTLYITVMSAILGTGLGIFLFIIYWQENKALNKIIDKCNGAILGIPSVVLLMIMYYVVFSNSILTESLVAIVTFTILLSIGVFGLIKTGVQALGTGQIESATDLGFTKKQTLLKIILPQAILNIMPLYKTKIVDHLKATAIVGYIAVQDLTKMTDMVRSRTFEAFFPLIVTAILYYILGRLLYVLLSYIEHKMMPGNHRSSIMKGVKTK